LHNRFLISKPMFYSFREKLINCNSIKLGFLSDTQIKLIMLSLDCIPKLKTKREEKSYSF
jgi:hypothetical protein